MGDMLQAWKKRPQIELSHAGSDDATGKHPIVFPAAAPGQKQTFRLGRRNPPHGDQAQNDATVRFQGHLYKIRTRTLLSWLLT